MVPLALGLVMGAGSSVKIVAKAGTTRVVTAGLLGMAALLTTTLLWTPHMSAWLIGSWFWGVALCMGWVMAPSTASVMGAVPSEKSGVASAMNDVTRQVGGSIGTAVVGSLISTIYASKIHDHVVSLPDASRTAAEDSIGKANAVASTLSGAQGTSLVDAAAHAFTDAIGIGLTLGAACAFLGALAVKRWLPARPQPVASETPVAADADRDERAA
jgi:DHA2 family integral membrane protein (MFS transporter)